MFKKFNKRQIQRKSIKSHKAEKDAETDRFLEFLAGNSRNGTRVIGVRMVSCRQFYDTNWCIDYLDLTSGESGSIEIVRYENDGLDKVCQALEGLERFDRETIKSLDVRSKIYYD